MIRIATILILLFLIPVFTLAQPPAGINYQAVARDGNGDILTNQSLTIRLTIKESGPAGTTVYQETHNTSTNDFGLFSLTIGQGSVVSGTFSNMDWGSNSHFLQVEVDDGGGYTNMGTTQFVSVPYALYAKEAGGGGGSYQAGTGIDITGNTISNTAPDQTITISGSGGTSVSGSYPNFTIASDPSHWSDNTTGIHYTGGSVGIGSNLPLQPLHVDGAVLFGSDTSGAGVRLRWIPAKNAVRSGEVQNSASSVWDWDSIGFASFAHGDNVLASGGSGVAIGSNVRARGLGSFAAGFGVIADGNYTFARGATVNAIGEASQASGSFAYAMDDYALALGTYDTASDRGAIAIGYVTAAHGEDAIAIGTEARAVGNNGIAIGQNARSTMSGYALGDNAWSQAAGATSIGFGTLAEGQYSLALGTGARTAGNTSVSIGWNTYTSDLNGVALGVYDTAGEQATAIGFYSSATGQGAIGMGRVSRATGTDAIAMGKFNRAAADNTIAIGVDNDANSLNALTFGVENTADGLQSLAMGWQSQARGDLSMAIGDGALADGMRSIALGSWNVGVGGINSSSPSSALFEIGNGINSGSRSNAFTILKNGRVGIGTTSPQELLHITGGTIPSLRIDNLEIGAVTSTNLGLDGDVVPYGGSATGYDLGNNVISEHWDDVVANDFVTFSDSRLKENIQPIQYGLTEILALNPRQYRLSSEIDIAQDQRMGLIAQELQTLMPELVVDEDVDRHPDTGDVTRTATEYLGVKYIELIPVLIRALQEENVKIEALEAQVEVLNQRLSDLESQ